MSGACRACVARITLCFNFYARTTHARTLMVTQIRSELKSTVEELRMTNFSKHISESYSSLPLAVISEKGIIVPNRLNSFVSVKYHNILKFSKMEYSCPYSELLELILQYCHYPKAPKEIKIDMHGFIDSYVCATYSFQVVGDIFVVEQDPVIPFLQSFLSQVETIELGSFKILDDFDKSCSDEYSLYQAALCVLLYNIVTIQKPSLKHIKVYGVRNVIEMILNVVNKFCSDCRYDDSPPVYPLVLASAPTPYLLKGLSIIHYDTVTESCKPVMKFRLDIVVSVQAISQL